VFFYVTEHRIDNSDSSPSPTLEAVYKIRQGFEVLEALGVSLRTG
jgi:hypothetical protein